VGAGGLAKQFALRFFPFHLAYVMLRRKHALGEVVGAREVGQAVCDGQQATREVGLEHRSGGGAEPRFSQARVSQTAGNAVGWVQFVGGQRTSNSHFIQHVLHVGRMRFEELLESIGTDSPRFHAVAQKRPALHRQDRRLVAPLLRELAPAVDEIVEARAFVGTEPRKEHQVVRRNEDVDEVELKQAELADRAADVTRVDTAPWA
jgi:hypothetical protein